MLFSAMDAFEGLLDPAIDAAGLAAFDGLRDTAADATGDGTST
jgi:hypothetical protein